MITEKLNLHFKPKNGQKEQSPLTNKVVCGSMRTICFRIALYYAATSAAGGVK